LRTRQHRAVWLEAHVSVDVEAAGPNPSQYSLLSIGACLVADPQRAFYVELQPVNDNATPEALAVSRLSLEQLAERGLPPAEAMARFEAWLAAEIPPDRQPIFVAFNAPFDWMFVNDYFHRFLGRNPFGHAALDLKALYMGLAGVHWSETTMQHVSARYLSGRHLAHHALRDAQDQAELFQAMLAEAASRGRGWP
jgi:DNA polymerase III epsilon subunit-like protein